jgi:citrate lyase subunit beta/citryl-CoA lyase
MTLHPSEVLVSPSRAAPIPVCDHYSGVQARMVKSLALQRELSEEFGTCVFDVTLDCEDGAPAGGELDHAHLVAELARSSTSQLAQGAPEPRVGVRVHPVDHPAFGQDLEIILRHAGSQLSYLMLPKIEGVQQLDEALSIINPLMAEHGDRALPVHVLVESPHALQQVAALAAHPQLESISFGLMDFVSAHGGAIPAQAMTYAGSAASSGWDQFSHPLVVRAKLEIAAACHAAGKVPSHCVVTEFKDRVAMEQAARQAAQGFGFTRMWSIHPDQIRPILAAMSPSEAEVEEASHIVCAAHRADWAPISVQGRLHDRASYRYYWQVLERAHQTGRLATDDAANQFFPAHPVLEAAHA